MSEITKPKCPLLAGCCFVHNFWHGAEAEELRERIENLVEKFEALADRPLNDTVDADMVAYDLRQILDDVDARDSAAYGEAKEKSERNPKKAQRTTKKKTVAKRTRKITTKRR
jgi:hypothetical protein